MSWGEGLVSWMQQGSVLGPALTRDAELKKRKEEMDNASLQRNLEYERQKEFAQNGLRWKVEDAKRAGIHPLAALGGTGSLYAPAATTIASGGSGPDYAGAFANAGQNVMRAVNATRTSEEREAAQLQTSQQLRMNELEVEGKMLHNDLMRSQIAQQNSMANPPFPTLKKPAEITMNQPGKPNQEAGSITDVGWVRSGDGGLTPVPSKDAKERIEDQVVQETLWSIRNNMWPNSVFNNSSSQKPSLDLLPKGAVDWEWNGFNYRPVYDSRELRQSTPPWSRWKRGK